MKSPEDDKVYPRSHPERRRGHFLKSPVDEKVYHRIRPMIGSVERDMRIKRGEVNEGRETLGWEQIRIQIDSGAVDAVGPKEVA